MDNFTRMDIPGYDSWKLMTPEEADPSLCERPVDCPACDGRGCSDCDHRGWMDPHDAALLYEALEDERIELEACLAWTLRQHGGELPECEIRGFEGVL